MPAITVGEGGVRYAKAVSSGPMQWQERLIGYISVNSLTARRVVQCRRQLKIDPLTASWVLINVAT